MTDIVRKLLLLHEQVYSMLTVYNHLQCMMDEWCSPYSSWLSLMKGCSTAAPPTSQTRIWLVESVWSGRASVWASRSESVFFSKLCGDQKHNNAQKRSRQTWHDDFGTFNIQTEITVVTSHSHDALQMTQSSTFTLKPLLYLYIS